MVTSVSSACHSHLCGSNFQCVAVTLQNLEIRHLCSFRPIITIRGDLAGSESNLHLQILEHHQRHRPLLFRAAFELSSW